MLGHGRPPPASPPLARSRASLLALPSGGAAHTSTRWRAAVRAQSPRGCSACLPSPPPPRGGASRSVRPSGPAPAPLSRRAPQRELGVVDVQPQTWLAAGAIFDQEGVRQPELGGGQPELPRQRGQDAVLQFGLQPCQRDRDRSNHQVARRVGIVVPCGVPAARDSRVLFTQSDEPVALGGGGHARQVHSGEPRRPMAGQRRQHLQRHAANLHALRWGRGLCCAGCCLGGRDGSTAILQGLVALAPQSRGHLEGGARLVEPADGAQRDAEVVPGRSVLRACTAGGRQSLCRLVVLPLLVQQLAQAVPCVARVGGELHRPVQRGRRALELSELRERAPHVNERAAAAWLRLQCCAKRLQRLKHGAGGLPGEAAVDVVARHVRLQRDAGREGRVGLLRMLHAQRGQRHAEGAMRLAAVRVGTHCAPEERHSSLVPPGRERLARQGDAVRPR
eukprot:scaffold13881_cov124-Isochrysis_galbana.AAC.2